MVKVRYKGNEVEATPIDVLSQEEFWNTYQLVDGTVLRLKVVVKDILKVVDLLTDDGGPIYITQSDLVTHIRKV